MPKHSHEKSDVNIRAVVISGFGLLGFMFLSFLVVVGIFRLLEWGQGGRVTKESVYGLNLPSEPRLQTTSAKDRREIIAAEEQILDHYGWIDQAKQKVHIPIEKAMKLMLKKGYLIREE